MADTDVWSASNVKDILKKTRTKYVYFVVFVFNIFNHNPVWHEAKQRVPRENFYDFQLIESLGMW
jgi:hypothetical protein